MFHMQCSKNLIKEYIKGIVMNSKSAKNCFIDKQKNIFDIYNLCKVKQVCRDDIANTFNDISYDRAGDIINILLEISYVRVAKCCKEHKMKRYYEAINLNTNYIIKDYEDSRSGLNMADKARTITIIGNRTIVRGFGKQDRVKHKPRGAIYTGINTFQMA